jgi:hypothetical protein
MTTSGHQTLTISDVIEYDWVSTADDDILRIYTGDW